jgi:hypothetical protein
VCRVQARDASPTPAAHLAEIRRIAEVKAEKRSWAYMLELKQSLGATIGLSGASLERVFREFDENGVNATGFPSTLDTLHT